MFETLFNSGILATLNRFSRCFDRLNWDVKQHSKRAEDIGPRYNGQLIAFKEHCGSYMAASHHKYMQKFRKTKTTSVPTEYGAEYGFLFVYTD